MPAGLRKAVSGVQYTLATTRATRCNRISNAVCVVSYAGEVLAVRQSNARGEAMVATSSAATIEYAMATSFRLQPIMRQGTASSVPETWTRYGSLTEARAGAKQMYHDDRVLRIMMVDEAGTFVERIER